MYSEYERQVLSEIEAQEFNPVLNEFKLVRFVSRRGYERREVALVVRLVGGGAISWHKFPFDTAATELDTPIWSSDPVQYFKDSLLDGESEPDN